MKKIILIIVFLSFIDVHSQDVIVKKDGTSIKVRVEEVGVDLIKYYKFDNLTGPIYSVEKRDVVIINFENGSFDLIKTNVVKKKVTLDEIKEFLIETINKYGYKYDSSIISYKAKFKNDILILTLVSNEIEGKKEFVYDFSEVFLFDAVSKRGGGVAYINIYVSRLINKRNDRWVKEKLVIRVNGHDKADLIYNKFRQLNQILLANKM